MASCSACARPAATATPSTGLVSPLKKVAAKRVVHAPRAASVSIWATWSRGVAYAAAGYSVPTRKATVASLASGRDACTAAAASAGVATVGGTNGTPSAVLWPVMSATVRWNCPLPSSTCGRRGT
ncbi:hypothetical protein P8C59_007720 [Phyllachora maydis]|uniref:Uncharacterized protein n=1 Tax=Phyllachora maydis TaxID=1825666 RepID=A0AAD9IA28_9PEZI|nr:hypothetical protein P8C59_007720 [Phyllachora maydis]